MKLYDYLFEQEQLNLVSECGMNLWDISNPSLALQLAAVSQNGSAILFIYEPSHEVKIAAVKQNPRVLRYIGV